MSWINENPVPLFTLGLLAQLVLGLILWQTGRGWIISAMVALAVVNLLLLIVAFVIVTDREEIAATLDSIGQTLELNDPPKLVEFISPSAPNLRNEATRILKRLVITEARVASRPEVRFDQQASSSDQPTATAMFLARVRAKDTKDRSPYEQLAQRLKVDLRKEDGRWLVTAYEANRPW